MNERQQLTPEQRQSLKSRGLSVGAKVGFVLSITYATFAVCSMLSADMASRRSDGGNIAGSIFGFLFILIVAWIYGTVPGTTIGLLTGALIATLLSTAKYPLSNTNAAWNGLFIGLIVVALMHAAEIGGGIGKPGYPIFLGLPSIIYLTASVWGAIWLKNTLRTTAEGEASAASLPQDSDIEALPEQL